MKYQDKGLHTLLAGEYALGRSRAARAAASNVS